MIRLLQLLFLGHVHKWKVIREVKLIYPENAYEMKREGRRYDLQCETCGEIQKRDLI